VSDSLNILMVWSRFLPEMGGIETHIHEVGRRLYKAGHRVTVLTTDRTGRLSSTETISGINVQRVPAWPKRRDYYFSPRIFTHVMSSRWDIIHIQGYHTLVAPAAMLAALVSGQPYVLTFHSGGHSSPARTSIRPLQQRILRPLLTRARHLIGVSEYEANHFSRSTGIDIKRFSVIANGADFPQKESPERPSDNLILSVGRLERYKGHHRAIRAMPLLLSENPNVELHIIGAGPAFGELQALAVRLGVEASVKIYAWEPKDRAGLAEQMGRAGLVVLFSDYEAHPVAVMEALALRRSVLTTHCTGFIELAEKGWIKTVPLDADDRTIAESMLAALGGELGKDVKLPSWDDTARSIEDVYRMVLRDEPLSA
jgi:glycosyltransferase involved in cell wall biosynthesis